jgi:hypothetical protein
VTLDDPVYRCQPDAESLGPVVALKALESSENFFRLLLIEA